MTIIDQIEAILIQIPLISEYPVKQINHMLPCDTSKDIKSIYPEFLKELKKCLCDETCRYNCNQLCHFLEQKFKV